VPRLANGRGRRRSGDTGVNLSSPQWMTTYSDMVTQLLAFFVILFSISTIDVQRFHLLLSAFRASVGVFERGTSLQRMAVVGSPPVAVAPTFTQSPATQQLQAAYEELSRLVARGELGAGVELVPEERGLVVRVADRVLFDLGKADLRPDAREVLDRVARVLKGLPNPIRVEGHTDDLPIRTERFPSNWELSTARATTVVRYLIERHGFEPKRLSAAGYGEYHPLVPNRSAADRQRNRRVDIVLLRLDSPEPPAQPKPAGSSPTEGRSIQGGR